MCRCGSVGGGLPGRSESFLDRLVGKEPPQGGGLAGLACAGQHEDGPREGVAPELGFDPHRLHMGR